MGADRIAEGLLAEISGDPAREAEAFGYHRAIIEKLNETHVNGGQDATCLLTGFGLALAQVLGNLAPDAILGSLVYVTYVARLHAQVFKDEGRAARHEVFSDSDQLPEFRA